MSEDPTTDVLPCLWCFGWLDVGAIGVPDLVLRIGGGGPPLLDREILLLASRFFAGGVGGCILLRA